MCSLDFGEIACNKYPVLLLLLLYITFFPGHRYLVRGWPVFHIDSDASTYHTLNM